ncbi:MAG: DUF6600 domain-containing protein [Gemmatimonadales bacterium]|jgi:hypothetical protein
MRRVPLLLGSLLPALAGTLLAQVPAAGGGNPPARMARIGFVSGSVSFQPSGDTAWSAATLNYPMTTGDRVYADRGARAELQIGSVVVRAADQADLTVTDLTDQFLQLGLTQGTIRVSVYQLAPGDSVEVDTPHGALTLLDVGDYRIDAPPGDSAITVTVGKGSLQWTAGGVAQVVQSGQAIRISGINPIQVASVPPHAPDGFDQWSAERDSRLKASASAQYVSRDIPGYDDLDGAGAWQVDPSYGPVWYPAGVPAGWVPYRYGHWVWIEPWGWTWVEHERWGYAPFHYGRWLYGRGAWGWLPGPAAVRPCYAPALVVFVDGSSAGAQAWFPLGPGEPYYPWYHHDGEYQRKVNVTNIRNATNIAQITDVTYINRIQYRNRGPGMTAVPTTGFQGRGPIAGRVLGEPAQRFATAPIAPHAFVLPGASAAAGGIPEPRPSTGRRPTWVTAPPPRPAQAAGPGRPLVVRRELPAAQAAPVLITRQQPPPQNVPFPQRQKAMQPDNGRPLEPQQIDNLRAGKPAGARRDPEYPPHPAAGPAAPPPRQPVGPAGGQAAPVPRQPANPAAGQAAPAPRRPAGPAPRPATPPARKRQP